MARVVGPLLSFGASGQIGQAQVYGGWRGIPYARRYVRPANPQTNEQMKTRDVFRWLNAVWLFMPALGKEPWQAYAAGRPFVDRNAWLSRNIGPLRTATDLAPLEGSPGANGGLPPESVTVTPASNQLTVNVTAPTAPSGWSVVAAQAILIPDQDPHLDLQQPIMAAQATSTPYTISFTGLEATTDYIVSAWLKWSRGTGPFAYSVSTTLPASTT